MTFSVDPCELARLVEHRLPSFLVALRDLVNVDSGSYSPQGVNQIAATCEQLFRESGWETERRSHLPDTGEAPLGDIVIGRLDEGAWPRLLLLAHMDTVFPDGSALARPFRVEGDRGMGPGISDMKAGLLAGFLAIDVLREARSDWRPSVTYVCTPDEEIGSPFSKPTIQEVATEVDACFVLEAGRENGNVVSARKGMATVQIESAGLAAHAGVEPERGRSAILDAAHKVTALHSLNGRWADVSVNVGVVAGGTRPNVVPAACHMEVDVRAADDATYDAALEEVSRIASESMIPGSSSTVTVLQAHRPMIKGPATGRLVSLVQEISRQLGYEVSDQSTGGASDGNTASAMGVPTLDGLGPVGGGPHSEGEWLDLTSIVPRVATLACLLARAGDALGQNGAY
jgi:glutamate carboxypeptidase